MSKLYCLCIIVREILNIVNNRLYCTDLCVLGMAEDFMFRRPYPHIFYFYTNDVKAKCTTMFGLPLAMWWCAVNSNSNTTRWVVIQCYLDNDTMISILGTTIIGQLNIGSGYVRRFSLVSGTRTSLGSQMDYAGNQIGTNNSRPQREIHFTEKIKNRTHALLKCNLLKIIASIYPMFTINRHWLQSKNQQQQLWAHTTSVHLITRHSVKCIAIFPDRCSYLFIQYSLFLLLDYQWAA